MVDGARERERERERREAWERPERGSVLSRGLSPLQKSHPKKC